MAETQRKYDPVKRREYYLKTRELKGRKPSKGQEKFRAGERKFGKADLAKAAKQVDEMVSKHLDKIMSQKKTLDKLEKDGKKNTPQYQSLLADYNKTLDVLSRIDPDADWTDSKRVPELKARISNVMKTDLERQQRSGDQAIKVLTAHMIKLRKEGKDDSSPEFNAAQRALAKITSAKADVERRMYDSYEWKLNKDGSESNTVGKMTVTKDDFSELMEKIYKVKPNK